MRIIRPLHDRVLIKQNPPKEQLSSGIYLPQNAREAYEDIGIVVAHGPGKVSKTGHFIEMTVKVGDKVIFKRRPDSELEDGHIMLLEEDILAVVDEG